MKKEEKCAIQENGTKKQSTEEQSPKEYSPVEESTLKRKLQYYSGEIQRDVGNLVKWLMIAVVVGCIVVNPETVSNKASTGFGILRLITKGIAPIILRTIQLNATVTNPSFV